MCKVCARSAGRKGSTHESNRPGTHTTTENSPDGTPHEQARRALYHDDHCAPGLDWAAVFHQICASTDDYGFRYRICPPVCCAHQYPCASRVYHQPALSLFTPLPYYRTAFAAPGSAAVAVDRLQPCCTRPAQLEYLYSNRESGYRSSDRTVGTCTQMKHIHILVIRPGAIGDVLLTFPVLQALREAYVNPQIALVSNAVVLPLALAYGIADEAFDYQDIRWSELFSEPGIHSPAVLDLLAQTDLAICWLRDPDHIVERNLRKAGVKRLIVAPGRPPEGTRVHIVDYLAGTIGHSPSRGGSGADEGRGPLWPPAVGNDPLTRRVSPLRAATRAPSPRPHPPTPLRVKQIAIHPGSGGTAKCWPAENFAEVIERLWQQNRPVRLLVGPADDDRLESILGQLSPAPKPGLVPGLANKPSRDVGRPLQRCRCYLGN